MLFTLQFSPSQCLCVQQILFNKTGINGVLMVAGKNSFYLILKAQKFFLAFYIQVQIPMLSKHINWTCLLYGIPG